MNNVIIIFKTKIFDETEYVFVNRVCIGSFVSYYYDLIGSILTKINADVIKEEVDIDNYLGEEDKKLFFSVKNNFFLTEAEQDAILAGQIDYAFDMIKNRLVEE